MLRVGSNGQAGMMANVMGIGDLVSKVLVVRGEVYIDGAI